MEFPFLCHFHFSEIQSIQSKFQSQWWELRWYRTINFQSTSQWVSRSVTIIRTRDAHLKMVKATETTDTKDFLLKHAHNRPNILSQPAQTLIYFHHEDKRIIWLLYPFPGAILFHQLINVSSFILQLAHMAGQWKWGQFQLTEAAALAEGIYSLQNQGNLSRWW